ncbi:hypothetical protein F4680DRAFT_416033 [Xylaria scruposa]|nr:hypothetical protein F4680DRAFT_416033 [Xylaria scruposa]
MLIVVKCTIYLFGRYQIRHSISYMTSRRGYLVLKDDWRETGHCCKQVLRNGYEWAWADTCIDKMTSVELSEAQVNVPLVPRCCYLLRA